MVTDSTNRDAYAYDTHREVTPARKNCESRVISPDPNESSLDGFGTRFEAIVKT